MLRFLVHLPPGYGPQGQGYKMGPLYTPPSLHLPALKGTKPVTPLHLPLYVTSNVTFPRPELGMTKQNQADHASPPATRATTTSPLGAPTQDRLHLVGPNSSLYSPNTALCRQQ